MPVYYNTEEPQDRRGPLAAYEGLSGQELFDKMSQDGLVEGFNSQVRGLPTYRINKLTDQFSHGDTIRTDQGAFAYQQVRGNLGHFRFVEGSNQSSPEAPEIPSFNFEMPEFDFPEIPTPSAANPGALDVQGLRARRGKMADLRIRRNLQAHQLSSIRKGASLAGLNLPVT